MSVTGIEYDMTVEAQNSGSSNSTCKSIWQNVSGRSIHWLRYLLAWNSDEWCQQQLVLSAIANVFANFPNKITENFGNVDSLLMTLNWWSYQCWYFWGFGNRITDPNQTCRLYRFYQHYCPLTNITRPCIRIIYIIYIIYVVKLYLEISVPLQFLMGAFCQHEISPIN